MLQENRYRLALAALLSVASAISFAQSSGEAVYKAKCLMCHGPAGVANSVVGKSMKVKPITDPSVRNMPMSEMKQAVKNGMGKMEPYKDKLTDAQIKDAVEYFRTFLK